MIEDENGVIQDGQELPSELKKLQSRKYKKEYIVYPDQSPWTIRLSTDAMSAWSLSLCFDAIKHFLNHLPNDNYKNFILKAYASSDSNFATVFDSGIDNLTKWWDRITSKGET